MGRVVGDAERAADDLGDPLAGPDLATKPVGLGPALQQGGELGYLRGAERGRGTWGRVPPQPLLALLAPTFEPLADGAWCHPERGGDILLLPALLLQLPSASPPPFAPVELGRLHAHVASVASL